ncbi:metallopeptidase TldD-related protein [Anaplasma phagocytophilum]|uniref:metallopeptidase TldD-related protein n=1 Tax=Anaplasma phagocytophilum TaxID=948 RepID=UPI0007E04B7B|nr:metallopeptidase TldD-related protein [Anaplasma phagocytophilum]SBO31619.1 protease TldD [Anaplasma phagocytophilum]SBO31682.1 protease TldD [Anaplasma phagocytophilum]SBO31703.1 protease TldD [Anaplasma phagocytophilum]SCV62663.1 protease TldD [Anaplasma phagocytophilum]
MEEFDVDKVFYARADRNKLKTLVTDTLHYMDGGELFLEFCHSESLSIENGIIKNADFSFRKGFGFRAFRDGVASLVCSSEISDSEIQKAASLLKHIGQGSVYVVQLCQSGSRQLYPTESPVGEIPFASKVQILQDIDAYLRGANPHVVQVKVSISTQWQVVQIIRNDGNTVGDMRPLVRLDIYVLVEKGGRKEHGRGGHGGRALCSEFITEDQWKKIADGALRQAMTNMEAVAAPAGEITVVLGPGFPGVLLHEAVGHGLESDFNRKKVSAFSDAIGTRVAAAGITVVDDGTMQGRRGSLNIDDEGTVSGYNVLIEDGILVSYMHDNMNSKLMGVTSTGNGRRESYKSMVIPRMTNTYMLPGTYTPNDIISSVKRGIYAADFGGGQVDITSGQFVFSASESYLIENGKIGSPLKGATLVGSGPEILKKVSMVGNDLALDPGIGTCSKDGQSIPVCVGQPTLKIDSITVGGTAM